MDLGSIFLILALVIAVGLYIAQPLFTHRSRQVTVEEHNISHLMAERDRLINALHELDFDYTLQKIPEEDYPLQRSILLQQGAEILRQLDQERNVTATDSAESRLERAIAQRRADMARRKETVTAGALPSNGSSVRIAGDDDLETLIANRKREHQDRAAGFCPQCGGPVQKSDRFCSKCGAKI